MKKYKKTGIDEYEIGEDFIKLKWRNGNYNTFNYESIGEEHIEKMKELAQEGNGLNKYYNNEVKKY